MIDKQYVRNRAIGRLKNIPPQEREATSNVLFIAEIKDAQNILMFSPMAGEPDVWPLIDMLLMRDKKILLPRLESGTIVACDYKADDILVNSSYGSMEPDIRYAVDSSIIEAALVPGVAFDLKGHRLGRGKGHYDRFLGTLTCFKIGLCFEMQIEEEIPIESHDVIMDAICTEKRLIRCGASLSSARKSNRR
jgi:5-formyltetrahydrofolate cyclo-ligase